MSARRLTVSTQTFMIEPALLTVILIATPMQMMKPELAKQLAQQTSTLTIVLKLVLVHSDALLTNFQIHTIRSVLTGATMEHLATMLGAWMTALPMITMCMRVLMETFV